MGLSYHPSFYKQQIFYSNMRTEIEIAVSYWCECLSQQVAIDAINSFKQQLSISLQEKFTKHWHPEFPERGQALREIVCDIENNYVDCYSRKGIRMWVDPGEVEICSTSHPYRKRVLYQQQSRSYSPELVSDNTPVYQDNSSGTVYYGNHPSMYYNNNYYDNQMYYDTTQYYDNQQQNYYDNQYYPVQYSIPAGM